jgi:DNA-binding transcriptional LysR family regulator
MPLHSTALRYFLAVARARSISGAAEAVHVVPSAISRQIQRLEDSIGCPLFDRGARGVALTEAGERLFSWAVEAQRHASDIIQELQGIGTRRVSTVRVGCTDAFTTGFMSNVITSFRRQHPEVFVHLAVGKPLEVTHWLQRGEVDCGLRFGGEAERDAHLLHTDRAPIRAVLSPSHPLAGEESIGIRQLVDHHLALPGAETTIHHALGTACSAENLRYQALYSGNISTLLSLAALGEAIVLASDFAARSCVQAGNLQAIPVRHPLFENRRVLLMAPLIRPLSPLADVFAREIANEMRLHSPDPVAA